MMPPTDPAMAKDYSTPFFKHCLPELQIKKSFSTKEKLEECIAIPINYKISLNRYKDLCKKILQIK